MPKLPWSFWPRRTANRTPEPAPLCAPEKVRVVLEVLDELDPRQVEILKRFYLDGQAESEILREFQATPEELRALREYVRSKVVGGAQAQPRCRAAGAGAD